MSTIQTQFIQEILQSEGKRFLRNQGMAIRKELKFKTKRLLQDRTATVLSSAESDAVLSIKTPHYGRLLDLRKKSSKLGKSGGARTSSKSYRIHNRFVMGHYYAIG